MVIDPKIKTEIQKRLSDLAQEKRVKVLLAVESGSRAWGFPSPDSDYDARFFYVHPRDWYLSLYEGRDVIEDPIQTVLVDGEEQIFDVNGWDLKKALKLLLKGNAVVLEWLQSAEIYHLNEEFRDDMLGLWELAERRTVQIDHYLGQLKRHWYEEIASREEVKIKKYFYALRPALAIKWLRENPDKKRVPMNIFPLMEGANISDNLKDNLRTLIANKAITKEMGRNLRIDEFDKFVLSVIDFDGDDQQKESLPMHALERAQDVFLKWSRWAQERQTE